MTFEVSTYHEQFEEFFPQKTELKLVDGRFALYRVASMILGLKSQANKMKSAPKTVTMC